LAGGVKAKRSKNWRNLRAGYTNKSGVAPVPNHQT